MTDLFAARSQMALSLGFHIVFASIGMAMPFLMAISHALALRTRDGTYLQLTKAWSKGVAIFFAVGAVSGTALSFELGLLWPGFMEHAGAVIGMPFSWEGTAFFLEAVALGLFLYGWERMPVWAHWFSGLVVGVCGVASGMFVVCANAWMNSPAGFDWVNGRAINIDPWAAMFNRAALGQGVHMVLAAFTATGFAVAGLHALALRRKSPNTSLHGKALRIAFTVGAIGALLQPISGDLLAKDVAIRQPAKLAAMEALFETSEPAPFTLGGWPFEAERKVRYGLEIPALLSFLAHGSFSAKVTGLDAFPREEWPSVPVVHLAFQVMIACGSVLALFALAGLLVMWLRPHWLDDRRALLALALATPLGFVAMEAGWVVTEVGRQPWIIYRILRTADAVSPMPGLVYPMAVFAALYGFLVFVVTWLMVRQFRALEGRSLG